MQLAKEDDFILGQKIDLLLTTGQMLIECLADSNRIERNMRRVVQFMNIPQERFQMHISYTTLMINISDGQKSITRFRKCSHHVPNMSALADISKLSYLAIKENYTLEGYRLALQKIGVAKRNYPRALVVLSAGLACAAFCKLFGCDWAAAGITLVATCVAIFCRQEMHHRNFNMYLTVAIAAFIAAFIAGLSTFLNISETPNHPIFASVLFLIPGIPIINSLDDMIDGFSIVGITRALIVFITLGAISFGMVLALQLLDIGEPAVILAPQHGIIIIALVAAIASTGFAIIFNVPISTLLVCAIGGAIAIVSRNILLYEFGLNLPLSSFFAALLVGFASVFLIGPLKVPAKVISIPPVIPMIPGVLMYKTIIGLMGLNDAPEEQQISILLQTINAGMTAGMTVLAISLGIAIPNVITRRYFSKLARPSEQ
ncbi:hypothetical protein AwDysgo_03190 [Bacteroidales bacterium]|nr:hypothetical protein AwDysgo_03190 [Bacteroidales bacterium]